ncbi:MAG: SigB/SigF/SigG family RNA polymerase sigma factor [candidate division WS1 bacterium]|jgi:RNA polymerase sigma-B factor|nr:SigB/SigF/SigG family RNA polymerase sigma factor [candidate division WS1 bacterium]
MSDRWKDLSTTELFNILRETNDPSVREHLIERHEGLVRHVANSYRDSGVPYGDLIGVGHIGLVNAVDRFDPERGTKFATFAVPTIRGELRRYFRDSTWGLRVPRRVQELSLQVREAREDLLRKLGRSPTYSELAASLNVTEEAVIEAIEVSNQYDLASLQEATSEDEGPSIADRAGEIDPNLELLDDREELSWALAQLTPRQRVIIVMRYFHELSQQQVADRLGISQMHVSRLQRRAIDQLREIMKSAEGNS